MLSFASHIATALTALLLGATTSVASFATAGPLDDLGSLLVDHLVLPIWNLLMMIGALVTGFYVLVAIIGISLLGSIFGRS